MLKHPVDRISWIPADTLQANDYNPNMVYNQELKLLKTSILKTGWIQPLLVSEDDIIIDGFHRWWLARNDEAVKSLSNGMVPVVRLGLGEAERMLLTIRINRAKGAHIAYLMAKIVKRLVAELGVPIERVMDEMGATRDEVELLMEADVFSRLDIKAHKYSKAWVPA